MTLKFGAVYGKAVLTLNDDGTWEGDPNGAIDLIRADERERIAAWLEERKIAAECDGLMWLDDNEIGWRDDVSKMLATSIRNNEHNKEEEKEVRTMDETTKHMLNAQDAWAQMCDSLDAAAFLADIASDSKAALHKRVGDAARVATLMAGLGGWFTWGEMFLGILRQNGMNVTVTRKGEGEDDD